MLEIVHHHRPITKAQIKSIHVALSRHGIDNDTYRLKLDAMFGVSSCKQLSRRDASALLRSLGYNLPNRPRKNVIIPVKTNNNPPLTKRATSANPPLIRGARGVVSNPSALLPTGVVSLPSLAQRRFITNLVSEIAWRVNDGYPHWLKKNMGLTLIATASQAARVIEGLKGLKAHQAEQ